LIAADTNILVYAHRADSEWHEQARSRIESLAQGRVSWGLPWPCIHEFLAIVSHPRIYDPPSTVVQALDQVDAWLESPVAEVLAETRQGTVDFAANFDGTIDEPVLLPARVPMLLLNGGAGIAVVGGAAPPAAPGAQTRSATGTSPSAAR